MILFINISLGFYHKHSTTFQLIDIYHHICQVIDNNQYACMVRGMIKNNVDFCYKKLYSQHRLIQTIPFCFGNCLDQRI